VRAMGIQQFLGKYRRKLEGYVEKGVKETDFEIWTVFVWFALRHNCGFL
jgi:hypothetical protein